MLKKSLGSPKKKTVAFMDYMMMLDSFITV